jgi:cell division protein FtsA
LGDIVVGIDIGTSKVCTLIGRLNKSNEIEVLGEGMDSCSGIKKGVIVDIESTARSIRKSVEQAEEMADIKVGSAYVNIMGAHVSIMDNRGWINISSEDREITKKDVEKLLYAVKDVTIPDDRQIIDIIPRQFIIDGYDEIIDPVGMVGVKLEVEADIIAGKITSVQNIVKSMEKANLKIDGLVVETFATSEMLLTPDEKDIGVVLLDVGGCVTDVSVYKNKRLLFYDSIPVGGDHITNDISIGLKISHADAERLKRQYELALTSLIKNDQEITLTELNENKKKNVKVSEVVEIIEARVYEIFSLCAEMLQKSNIGGNFSAGVVLTGGGISYVEGAKQLAAEVFELPARVASIKLGSISKPEYITASGLIKYVSSVRKGNNLGSEVKMMTPKNKGEEATLIEKITSFFKKLF